MFPVAVGLALAPLAALGWVKALDRPMLLRRRTGHLELTEGQSVDVGLEVRPDTGGPLPGRAVLLDRLGQHARHRDRAGRRRGRVLRGRYEIAAAPRGRYRLDGAELLIADPFGLARGADPAGPRRPRCSSTRACTTWRGCSPTAARPAATAGRSMLHRTAGLRPAQHPRAPAGREPAPRALALDRPPPQADGEGARRTPRATRPAWCSTARPRRSPGRRPTRRFDVQVRAAASLLRRMSDAGQRCSLVIHARAAQPPPAGVRQRRLGAVLASWRRSRPTAPRAAEPSSWPRAARRRPGRRRARVRRHRRHVGRPLAERLLALRSAQRDSRWSGSTAPPSPASGRRRAPAPGGGAAADALGHGGGPDPRRRPRRQGAVGTRAAPGGGACDSVRRVRVAPRADGRVPGLLRLALGAAGAAPHRLPRAALLALLGAVPTRRGDARRRARRRRCSRWSRDHRRDRPDQHTGRGRPGHGFYPVRDRPRGPTACATVRNTHARSTPAASLGPTTTSPRVLRAAAALAWLLVRRAPALLASAAFALFALP